MQFYAITSFGGGAVLWVGGQILLDKDVNPIFVQFLAASICGNKLDMGKQTILPTHLAVSLQLTIGAYYMKQKHGVSVNRR